MRTMRTMGFRAGLPYVGRAAQGDVVIEVKRDQQHAECAGALSLGLSLIHI